MNMTACIRSKCSSVVVVLSLVGAGVAVQGCAPSRAKMVREQRATTIGLLGASYRPKGNVGVGVTGGASKNSVDIDSQKQSYATNKSDDANVRKMAETSQVVAPFVHYYPWDTSAFFVGAGANFSKYRYTYDEEKEGSTALAPSSTEVKYDITSTDIHAPLGWNWIWENGITLMLDFGPSMSVSHKGKYSKDGDSEGVNTTSRDQAISALDKAKSGGLRFSGTSLIGYSF